MVQKEVKKKAQAYGLMAILLASVCVALIYSAGTGPITSPGPSPSANPTNNPSTQNNAMRTFGSYDELKTFLATNNPNSQNAGNYYIATNDARGNLGAPTAVPEAAPAQVKDFSSTNIQVAGVDEADSVKTDGNYLYVIANNSVHILDANRANARVLQKIPFENAYLSGIYLSDDGNRLAVLGTNYMVYDYTKNALPTDGKDIMLYPYYRSSTTFACVYDVSNKNAVPVLARNLTMSGDYFNSRMIGNYLYDIVTEYAYMANNDIVLLPAFFKGAEATNIPATNVYFSNVNDSYGPNYNSYTFTTFLAIDLLNDAAEPTNMTIMLSGADQVYVSKDNIYITYPVYEWNFIAIDLAKPAPTITVSAPDAVNGSTGTGTSTIMPEAPMMWRAPSTTKTTVYRVQVDGDALTFAAQGNVTGTVLQQYAMDESNGYFRMATTAYVYDNETSYMGTQQNNVYVLDMNLNIVGKVENIGTGENFHAARFIGNRCYLVTFMNTDPLFVIDLTQPTNPQVLGELVMPGYSDYLHPYDETHLIGVGKDAKADNDTGRGWYQGLKLSLFDVSNVNAPTEIDQVIIGDRGTDSEVLYNPKAFLFNKERNLLVLPISLYLINENAAQQAIPEKMVPPVEPSKPDAPTPTTEPGRSNPSAYGQFVWQGVYVFKVTLDGFEVRGNITQVDNPEVWLNDPSVLTRSDYQWMGFEQFITRALYIEDVLYTISNSRVQLNDLNSLALIAKVELD